ncbi:uncharacterized protein At1g32220, chloroplastic-like isoform X3 [Primulina tabacum]|uniref:uncharacterized protein At1g32220, chloroplastic-like isoform X3 n=1 Tax=Primulina tabacum TaxID=48773 RepID=UPI003F5A5104
MSYVSTFEFATCLALTPVYTKGSGQSSIIIKTPTLRKDLIFSGVTMSRFIRRSKLSSIVSSIAVSRKGRFLSTVSDKPFNNNIPPETDKVDEAETIHVPPPPTEKLLVLGGNGFVGSHICKEALGRGLTVSSLSRSGGSSIGEPWANSMIWHQGNLFSMDSWKDVLKGVTSVISCVGGFGSNAEMYKINGTANINAIRAASEEGVKRFVYISAADFGVVNYVLRGYYEGKLSIFG